MKSCLENCRPKDIIVTSAGSRYVVNKIMDLYGRVLATNIINGSTYFFHPSNVIHIYRVIKHNV